MTPPKFIFAIAAIFFLTFIHASAQTRTKGKATNLKTGADDKQGKVVTEKLTSTILHDNRVGLDPVRSVKIYLPPGYANSGKAYPVVYYCHNFFSNNEKLFEDGKLVNLLERGFANGVVNEFILVAADYSTATTGSLYENSIVSGRWLDFTAHELVPFIDSKFRTLRQRDSRALTGNFFGGRGALKLAMVHAELFSVVYAMHPVATGTGPLPWVSLQIDWKKIYQAKSLADLQGDGRAQIFVTICQGFLPNLNRPPFYCDFFMELENGEPTVNVENISKAKAGFHLQETLASSASNLKTMRGLALDWGRFDPNQDHVFSNREFSRDLEDLGIEHEAEEYRGDPFSRIWTDNGRFYTRVLPFFANHLIFDGSN
jgi:enterochelin esterase-like enzyme